MVDHAFCTAMYWRIGHPHPDIRMDTRCQCNAFTMAKVPCVPGPDCVDVPVVGEVCVTAKTEAALGSEGA